MNNSTTRSSSKIFLSSLGQNKVVNSTTLNTDITFYFDPILLGNYEKSHFVLGLEQASIPVSIYMINSSNNVITINGVTTTLAIGNYTITSLIDILNTTTGYSFTYVPISNQIILSVIPDPVCVISGSASSILGFVPGTYADVHYFAGVVNLTSTTGIVIQIENVTTTNRDNSGHTGATLARIPLTCGVTKILQYFNPTPFFTQIGNRELTYLRIRLLNDDYSPLTLVGNPPWFMVIRVDYSDKTPVENLPNQIANLRAEQNKQILQANIDALNR